MVAIPDKNGRVKLVFYFPKSYVALWDNMEIPSDQEVTFSPKNSHDSFKACAKKQAKKQVRWSIFGGRPVVLLHYTTDVSYHRSSLT